MSSENNNIPKSEEEPQKAVLVQYIDYSKYYIIHSIHIFNHLFGTRGLFRSKKTVVFR